MRQKDASLFGKTRDRRQTCFRNRRTGAGIFSWFQTRIFTKSKKKTLYSADVPSSWCPAPKGQEMEDHYFGTFKTIGLQLTCMISTWSSGSLAFLQNKT